MGDKRKAQGGGEGAAAAQGSSAHAAPQPKRMAVAALHQEPSGGPSQDPAAGTQYNMRPEQRDGPAAVSPATGALKGGTTKLQAGGKAAATSTAPAAAGKGRKEGAGRGPLATVQAAVRGAFAAALGLGTSSSVPAAGAAGSGVQLGSAGVVGGATSAAGSRSSGPSVVRADHVTRLAAAGVAKLRERQADTEAAHLLLGLSGPATAGATAAATAGIATAGIATAAAAATGPLAAGDARIAAAEDAAAAPAARPESAAATAAATAAAAAHGGHQQVRRYMEVGVVVLYISLQKLASGCACDGARARHGL